MIVVFSLLEFEGGKCWYYLLIFWFVIGAWFGVRVVGLYGFVGFWEEVGCYYYEKAVWYIGGV